MAGALLIRRHRRCIRCWKSGKYCPEVFEKLDIVVDGGIKRGTDVVKALAMGAKAVGIGRAALFGLGAGGTDVI
jgi:isopentenyl diphosphate isomerase/L-lactate dehydrogenase-like FMN-dependent dehydrogenase